MRDKETKRYLFVMDSAEAAKMHAGISRLRKGRQVRSMEVKEMSTGEARKTIEMLGWV